MRKLAVLMMMLAAQSGLWASLSMPEWIGGEGTVHAEWFRWDVSEEVFPADSWSAAAASELSVPDAPDAMIYEEVCFMDQHDGREGVLMLKGLGYSNMDFFIPNYDQGILKEIRIEITYQSLGYDPLLGLEAYADEALLKGEIWGPYLDGQQAQEGNWITEAYRFMITSCSDYEFITLGFDYSGDAAIAVDRVMIDTVCVPEPATMGMLALGAMVLFRKK